VHTLLVTIWQFAIPASRFFPLLAERYPSIRGADQTNWLEALKQPLDPTELVPSKFVGTIKTLAAWSKSMES
jgi:hypothetical protein